MAKKFVRGITDVKDIKNFDKSLTNVNDIISDGQNTYIHTKKGENELYYKLTDRVTSIKSTGKTITVEKSDDGTVSLKTNPEKVLEHENLTTDYGIIKTTSGNTAKLGFEYTRVKDGFDLNTLTTGNIRGYKLTNAPSSNGLYYVQSFGNETGDNIIQTAFNRVSSHSESTTIFRRSKIDNRWGEWREQVTDKSVIDGLLSQKQDVLTTGDGLTMSFDTDETTIMFKATKKPPETNLNTLGEGVIRGRGFSIDQVPSENQDHSAAYVTINTSDDIKVQFYIRESGDHQGKIRLYYRFIINDVVTEWKQMVGDSDELKNELTQKQNAIENNTSIGVSGNGLRQLYTLKQTYTHANGVLKTHVKSVSSNTNISTAEEEFNFILKINQGQQSATFTLNEHDKTKFNNIITTYGVDSSVRINGCLFTLSDTTLTVSTEASTVSNHVITFSDII